MSLAILFHFLCTQHVSDINISIIRSVQLLCRITTLVVLFLVRCVLEFRCGWVGVVSVLQASACNTDTTPTQPQRSKNNTTNVVIERNSCTLLMMDILMSETCWAHKKWNKIASDIKLVFYSSTITMMHGPIYIRHVCFISLLSSSDSVCWFLLIYLFIYLLMHLFYRVITPHEAKSLVALLHSSDELLLERTLVTICNCGTFSANQVI